MLSPKNNFYLPYIFAHLPAPQLRAGLITWHKYITSASADDMSIGSRLHNTLRGEAAQKRGGMV